MPAQKRSPSALEPPDAPVAAASAASADAVSDEPSAALNGFAEVKAEPEPESSEIYGEGDDEYVDFGGDDDPDDDWDKDGFVLVRLSAIRKEVQCPICLGIIKKTRTVMECLHRFCRECIDRSMRLGNNECPSCRTHCASRRSLRDDPNYDALISALYPDIEKYEEEELAFNEEERIRNKMIQESIAETYQRQSEALGKKKSTAAYVRRSRKSARTRGRDRSATPEITFDVSDDDIKNKANGIHENDEHSSADELSDARQKRARKWSAPRSPARPAVADVVSEDNDDTVVNTESLTTSPLRVGNREILAWGKNAARSQTRHGSSSSIARMAKSSRISKLTEHLRKDEFEDEMIVHLVLLPMEGLDMLALEKPHLCCRKNFTVGQLCKFVAIKLSREAEEIDVYANSSMQGCIVADGNTGPSCRLEKLAHEKTLAELLSLVACGPKDMELVYSLRDPVQIKV